MKNGTEFLDELKDRVHELYDENKRLKERINRAIEYIKSNDNYFLSDSYMKILEILKGEDREWVTKKK